MPELLETGFCEDEPELPDPLPDEDELLPESVLLELPEDLELLESDPPELAELLFAAEVVGATVVASAICVVSGTVAACAAVVISAVTDSVDTAACAACFSTEIRLCSVTGIVIAAAMTITAPTLPQITAA